jgi:hypothetical protein
MSKPVTDILGRMQGNVLALKGMYDKLSIQIPPSNPTFEQTPAPTMASLATHEDYSFVQKLLKEIEAQAHDASVEIDKILQVPQPPGEGGTTPPPESGLAPSHPIAGTSPGAPSHQPGNPQTPGKPDAHKK